MRSPAPWSGRSLDLAAARSLLVSTGQEYRFVHPLVADLAHAYTVMGYAPSVAVQQLRLIQAALDGRRPAPAGERAS
ncbi:hypothetical protein [Actinoplanes sp. RD1]|uniref:hypothetical protein n=1 Tax=Actinoplanes sp. RD1 TaxID=3064538 RepID=UPI0027406A0A|nr:hypothetical protein [Actinoplanes sp. RD1]